MDLGTISIVVIMTLLFFGAIVWMAIYSRRNKSGGEASNVSEIETKGK